MECGGAEGGRVVRVACRGLGVRIGWGRRGMVWSILVGWEPKLRTRRRPTQHGSLAESAGTGHRVQGEKKHTHQNDLLMEASLRLGNTGPIYHRANTHTVVDYI